MLLFVRKVCSVSRALETYVWSSFFYTCYGTADFKRSVCPMTSCTGPHFSISLFSRSNFPIARRLFLIVLLIVLTFSFNTLRTIWGYPQRQPTSDHILFTCPHYKYQAGGIVDAFSTLHSQQVGID